MVTGKPGLADSGWWLRRAPTELINWPATNSKRLDVDVRKDWLACCNQSLATSPLPPDESPDHDSGYTLDGGSPFTEGTPTRYLHAYWMSRFNAQGGVAELGMIDTIRSFEFESLTKKN